ncbi:hypothetical protein NJB1907f44_49000 [Mycobacterium marinum]|uniref:helix-turn-helix domain-containing protein n=1 Tax=Mycobacterium marinum TaxID=1781 RepID=UPI000E3EE441|nr:helix-turn-helix domain-containing protein [Mycobacterium marinum]RFZ30722.1 Helix-turn-helix domain protein [Mycobacterium marinum]GJN99127.1 hypothetical protein NJB1907E8_50350 [Mycobacterium marinum]GJO06056.1 hypothetical protein NJB1907E90_16790 [Mycobacterium marinum]GJO10641.1 hypothetical protein NJB1808e29_46570 [Mycobacterium marinum]GJO14494.1 hypothetical protein NJB1907f34b_51010 [Mycobacterium marinum]
MAHPKSPPRTNLPHENRATKRARRYGKISEAAEILGVTDRTVRAMIADGRLVGYRSGNRLVRVDLNQIDDVMRPSGGAA